MLLFSQEEIFFELLMYSPGNSFPSQCIVAILVWSLKSSRIESVIEFVTYWQLRWYLALPWWPKWKTSANSLPGISLFAPLFFRLTRCLISWLYFHWTFLIGTENIIQFCLRSGSLCFCRIVLYFHIGPHWSTSVCGILKITSKLKLTIQSN